MDDIGFKIMFLGDMSPCVPYKTCRYQLADTGYWMLEKRNDFINVIQYPESSIQYLILMRHELLKL